MKSILMRRMTAPWFIACLLAMGAPGCSDSEGEADADGAGGAGGGDGSGGGANDMGPPQVVSTLPIDEATGVFLNRTITTVFSEKMAATVTDSISVSGPDDSDVAGTVSFAETTLAFAPTEDLEPNTLYTVTIADTAEDLAGNALEGDYVWSFTTGTTTALGPNPVDLGSAANYVLLAKAGISATAGTAIVGNVGVSPAAESALTGFDQTRDSTDTFSTSALVTGQLEASNMATPTPANLTAAIGSMETAYTDAAGRTLPDFTEHGAGDISGLTLVPGLYKWSSGVLISSDVVLAGGPNDVWIFQIAQELTVENGVHVTLSGGAVPENVFWQVAGKGMFGTTTDFQGNVLGQTQLVFETGAVLHGRALAQTAVTLDAAAISAP